MKLHPENKPVPTGTRTSRIWLRPLGVDDLDLDYEAVMSSVKMLQTWCPDGSWPSAKMTLEEDRADLVWHEEQFKGRKSFTYTVLDPKGVRCLGCVYINPVRPEEVPLCGDAEFAADVGFWVRESELANKLDRHLLKTLLKWFKEEWEFEKVLFTVSRREARQAALFASLGLELRLSTELQDGSPVVIYG